MWMNINVSAAREHRVSGEELLCEGFLAVVSIPPRSVRLRAPLDGDRGHLDQLERTLALSHRLGQI